MDTYQIIAGFSEIKSELRTKARIQKSLDEITLWFSFEENILYVHDYDDHFKCMILAIYNRGANEWMYFLAKSGYGKMLVEDVCTIYSSNEIIRKLMELYRSHGFIPFYQR